MPTRSSRRSWTPRGGRSSVDRRAVFCEGDRQAADNPRVSTTRNLPPNTAGPEPAPPRLSLMTLRELATVVVSLVVLAFAFSIFDEIRKPLGETFKLAFFGSIAYFGGRAIWRWSALWSPEIAWVLLWKGFRGALGGWLAVAFSIWIRTLSSENYALIILAPISMLMALFFVIVGVLGGAAGTCIALRGARAATPHQGTVIAGMASAALNLGQVVTQAWIFFHD